jgi:hypothetical protein
MPLSSLRRSAGRFADAAGGFGAPLVRNLRTTRCAAYTECPFCGGVTITRIVLVNQIRLFNVRLGDIMFFARLHHFIRSFRGYLGRSIPVNEI